MFGKRDRQVDKTTIIYNSYIKLIDIPSEAYNYIVNGKSAYRTLSVHQRQR
jgi:predicted helicase